MEKPASWIAEWKALTALSFITFILAVLPLPTFIKSESFMRTVMRIMLKPRLVQRSQYRLPSLLFLDRNVMFFHVR